MSSTTAAGQSLRRLLAEIGGDNVGRQMVPARRIPQLLAQLGTIHHWHLHIHDHRINRLHAQLLQPSRSTRLAVVPGQAQPDIGGRGIGGNAAAFGIQLAELVLGRGASYR